MRPSLHVWLVALLLAPGCGGSGDPADSGSDAPMDGGDGDHDADVAEDADADGDADQDADADPDDDVDADPDGDADADAVEGLLELVWEVSPTLGDVHRLAIQDLDGDGDVDLLVSAPAEGRVYVFEGLGDGTFDIRRDRRLTTEAPLGIAAASLGHDARADLAVAHGTAGGTAISLYPGGWDLEFGSPASLVTGSGPAELRAADVTCDGQADLLALCTEDGGALVEHAAGTDGTPTSPGVAVVTGLDASGFDVGRIDGDACSDAVLLDASAGLARVLLGSSPTAPAPGLTEVGTVSVGDAPERVIVGDLTGDGLADIVVTRPFELMVAAFAGDGAGGFSLHDLVMVHRSVPAAMAIGLVDGDDLPDLVVGTCGTRCGGPGGTDVYLLSGEADGLAPARPLGIRGGIDRWYTDIALVDLDEDGSVELIVLARGSSAAVEVYRRRL